MNRPIRISSNLDFSEQQCRAVEAIATDVFGQGWRDGWQEACAAAERWLRRDAQRQRANAEPVIARLRAELNGELARLIEETDDQVGEAEQ